MYNVKEIYYPDGVETRVYSRVYVEDKEVEKRVFQRDPFNNRPVMELNNFEEYEERKKRSMVVSRKRAINTIYELARSNVWAWFVTLTFDPAKVDRFDYAECGKKLSKWLNNLHSADPELKYLVVPELHKDGAYHFHGLFSHSPALHMIPSGITDKKGRIIYNIGRYRFGFTTATAVENNEAVTKYVTKYVTKELLVATEGKKRFWASRNLSRPEKVGYFMGPSDRLVFERELQDDCTRGKVIHYGEGDLLQSVGYYETKGGLKDGNLSGWIDKSL